MNSAIKKKVEKLINEGYEFEFGDYLSEGWRLLSDNAGTFIAYTLVSLIITIICMIIPVVGWLALAFVVGPALFAGYFYMAQEADLTGNVEVSTGFKGFKQLGKIIPVWLLIGLITIISYLPYLAAVGPDIFSWFQEFRADPLDASDPPNGGIFGLLSLIPYYFKISYLFAIPLVIFRDMDAWEAMEASRKIIGKKWFIFLAFYFLTSMMAGIGFILFFIGLFFTIALSFTPLYAAFEDIVGTGNEEEDYEDDLDHLIV